MARIFGRCVAAALQCAVQTGFVVLPREVNMVFLSVALRQIATSRLAPRTTVHASLRAISVVLAAAACACGGGSDTTVASNDDSPFLNEYSVAATPAATEVYFVESAEAIGAKAATKTNSIRQGIGELVFEKRNAKIKAGQWLGGTIDINNRDTVIIAVLLPVSGNPNVIAGVANKTIGKVIRYSAFSGTHREETHIFRSDAASGEQTQIMIHAYEDSEYHIALFKQSKASFILPVSGYEPDTVPISGVMDNDLLPGNTKSNNSMMLFDGTIVKSEYGCKKYTPSGYSECLAGDIPSTTVYLGYRSQSHERVLSTINYTESHNTYAYYDGHTGYDFDLPKDTPVYAIMGGKIKITNDSWNDITIDSGNGILIHYLHMPKENQKWIKDGSIIPASARIGSVGGTGGVAPHLHVSFFSGSDRIDPFGSRLWR